MLLVKPIAKFAIADGFHVERLAGQIHQGNVGGSILRLDVSLDALGFRLHHPHEFMTRIFNFFCIIAFK